MVKANEDGVCITLASIKKHVSEEEEEDLASMQS